MEDSKKWYESKTIWGGIIGVLSVIAGAFGYAISPDDQAALSVAIMGIGSSVGSLIAIWGRTKASKTVK